MTPRRPKPVIPWSSGSRPVAIEAHRIGEYVREAESDRGGYRAFYNIETDETVLWPGSNADWCILASGGGRQRRQKLEIVPGLSTDSQPIEYRVGKVGRVLLTPAEAVFEYDNGDTYIYVRKRKADTDVFLGYENIHNPGYGRTVFTMHRRVRDLWSLGVG